MDAAPRAAFLGGLAEWQCAGFENQWEQSLAGSNPASSANFQN